MLICRKCNEEFKTLVRIDGVKHNLCNRKFCLKCSPFKSHNTKTDDPSKPTVKPKIPYNLWTEDRKKEHRESTTRRGHKLKREMVDLKGGKCEKCGYDKCTGALHFHHIDPSQKKFRLNVADIRAKKREDVILEVNKCKLLCANCHAEEHFTFEM